MQASRAQFKNPYKQTLHKYILPKIARTNHTNIQKCKSHTNQTHRIGALPNKLKLEL